MEKDFTPYEQALALKELGFNRRTFAQYNTRQGDEWILTFDLSGEGQYPNSSSACVAPTFSQAFRWFREKYLLSYSIRLTDNSSSYFFKFIIYDSKNRHYNDEDCWDSCRVINDIKEYSTHEEAELECLKKLIEIVKTKEVC